MMLPSQVLACDSQSLIQAVRDLKHLILDAQRGEGAGPHVHSLLEWIVGVQLLETQEAEVTIANRRKRT